jgi:hypothetical protein
MKAHQAAQLQHNKNSIYTIELRLKRSHVGKEGAQERKGTVALTFTHRVREKERVRWNNVRRTEVADAVTAFEQRECGGSWHKRRP